jgi:hypothetical protein
MLNRRRWRILIECGKNRLRFFHKMETYSPQPRTYCCAALELRHGFNVESFRKNDRRPLIRKCRKLLPKRDGEVARTFALVRRGGQSRRSISIDINLNFEAKLHDILESSAEKPWLNRIRRGEDPRAQA